MTRPAQSQTILAPPADAAIFLVVTVRPGGEQTLLDLFADIAGLVRSVGFREPRAELTLVVGIGAAIWPRLYSFAPPAQLHPFRALSGDRHSAPSTPGDVLFHIRARRIDVCFELASLITGRMKGQADVVDEVHGFRYFDSRDLMGFVDGTENPEGADAAATVYIAEDQEPEYAGGSYVIVQKYLHDMDAWNALPTAEQEKTIGRYKLNDVEMADDVKPANSHVALNTIVDESGEEQDILRDNMPFGRLGSDEFGTYFIGYAANAATTETMLEHMFIGDPPGNHDRILDFSTALTGSLFFVPTADFLEDPGAAMAAGAGSRPGADHAATLLAGGPASVLPHPDVAGEPPGDEGNAEPDDAAGPDAPSTEDPPTDVPPSDGSLGIGSLKA